MDPPTSIGGGGVPGRAGFMFSVGDLERSPSILDGMTLDDEAKYASRTWQQWERGKGGAVDFLFPNPNFPQ